MNFSALRHLGRMREVLGVLARRGYGRLVARLPLPFSLPGLGRRKPAAPLPEDTRRALEELGPTFVKIGQVLSTRRDLIPRNFIEELEQLQENVAPFPGDQVSSIVEEDLGRDPRDIFDEFELEPLASASIAQVHHAVYRGKPVVVKVQRPGIARTIEEDMEILEFLAELVHEYIEEAQIYEFPTLVREFGRSLRGELNFRREADSLDLFARGFADWGKVRIPRVFREVSGDRVITMEHLVGNRISRLASMPEDARRDLALVALEMSFYQFFDLGFFHADPHPGNLIAIDGGTLGLMDFGRIGVVDERMESRLAELMGGIIDRDYPLVTDVLLDIARPARRPDKLRLLRDLTELVEFNYQKSVEQISVGEILTSMLDLLQHHRLVVPSEYITLVGAVITAEASARTVYPELNPIEEMKPHVRRALLQRFSPGELAKRARRLSRRVVRDAGDVSRDLVSVVSQAERGDFTLRFRHEGLEGFLQGLGEISKRLTAGVITASLIIGGSIIIGVDQPPHLLGYPALGALSLAIATVLGLWLLITRR